MHTFVYICLIYFCDLKQTNKMPPKLTQDQKVMIIDYWRQGFTRYGIAQYMHRYPSTFSYWINRWEAERTIVRRPGTGHHFADIDDEEANIYVRACNFPFETPEKIRNTLGLQCSVDTVWLVLKSLGIKRYRAHQTETDWSSYAV